MKGIWPTAISKLRAAKGNGPQRLWINIGDPQGKAVFCNRAAGLRRESIQYKRIKSSGAIRGCCWVKRGWSKASKTITSAPPELSAGACPYPFLGRDHVNVVSTDATQDPGQCRYYRKLLNLEGKAATFNGRRRGWS